MMPVSIFLTIEAKWFYKYKELYNVDFQSKSIYNYSKQFLAKNRFNP